MKSIQYYSHILLATIILLTGSALMAQDEENEMQEQIVVQEEEMRNRKKMLEQQREQMKQMEQQHADQMRDMEFRARESSRARSVIHSSGVNQDGVYLIESFGQDNQSQLTLRKNFRGTSNTSKGEFEVEKSIRHFRCRISGSVKSGEILIGIEYPDGKTFKELVINSSADINFSQSISIKEGEEKKYTGSWSYMIKAEEAEGSYMVQIISQ